MELLDLNYSSNQAPHYSAAVIHNGIVYVSGQLAIGADGKLIEGGIREHTLQALKNLERILQAAGTDSTHVLQCRIYTSDLAYWESINQVYSIFFGDHKPARTIVPSRELHYGSLVEIEATAFL